MFITSAPPPSHKPLNLHVHPFHHVSLTNIKSPIIVIFIFVKCWQVEANTSSYTICFIFSNLKNSCVVYQIYIFYKTILKMGGTAKSQLNSASDK